MNLHLGPLTDLCSRKGSNEFRLAAQQDGGIRITHYSDKEWGEYFAEYYSLYVTDPDAMRRLRPHVFAIFKRRFPG